MVERRKPEITPAPPSGNDPTREIVQRNLSNLMSGRLIPNDVSKWIAQQAEALHTLSERIRSVIGNISHDGTRSAQQRQTTLEITTALAQDLTQLNQRLGQGKSELETLLNLIIQLESSHEDLHGQLISLRQALAQRPEER